MKSKLSLYACSILFMFTCTSTAVASNEESRWFKMACESEVNAEPMNKTDNRYYNYNDYSVSIKMDDDACMQATILEKPTTVMGAGITYRDGACHITAVVKDDVTAIDMPRKTIKLPIRWGKTIKLPIRWGESKASWDSSEVSTVTLKLQSDS